MALTRDEATKQMSREVFDAIARLTETEDFDILLIVVGGEGFSTSTTLPPPEFRRLLLDALLMLKEKTPVVEDKIARTKKESVN